MTKVTRFNYFINFFIGTCKNLVKTSKKQFILDLKQLRFSRFELLDMISILFKLNVFHSNASLIVFFFIVV